MIRRRQTCERLPTRSTRSRWPRWRPTVAASVAVALVAGPLALAGSAGTAHFTSPGSFGAVDFGDRVLYRLQGAACVRDAVHVAVTGTGRRTVRAAASRPARDPLDRGSCVGIVTVPSEGAVRRAGWDAGDPLEIVLVSKHDRHPLRYQRVEVEYGRRVAGAPQVMPATVADPRAGKRDRVLQMTTGDIVSLGRVDLARIHSISLRVCMVLPKPHVSPTFVELRATAADGPAIVGPVDVNDDALNSYKSNLGWPNCWQLQTWPITGKVPGRAPELFLAVTAAAGGPVQISYLDVNGSGAKIPHTPVRDPRGAKRIFDGTSFKGWEQTNCALDEGGVRPVHSRDPRNYAAILTAGFVGESGCSMTYTARKLHNVSIRLDYRLQDYGDNGGVYLGSNEIQMREAGEWLTGGFLGSSLPAAAVGWAAEIDSGGYPAQRVKNNTYPDWSRLEVTQIGARFIVRINGRTVTDCSNCAADPGAFTLRLVTQPNFSYQYGVHGRFDSTYYPYVEDPANWGNLYYRNVRVYDCSSVTDPVCTGGPGVQG